MVNFKDVGLMGVRRKETIPRDLREGVAPCIGNRILESQKFLVVESGILGSGILNTAQGIWNLTND